MHGVRTGRQLSGSGAGVVSPESVPSSWIAAVRAAASVNDCNSARITYMRPMSMPKAASASRMVKAMEVAMRTKPLWDRRVLALRILDGQTPTISSSARETDFLSLVKVA